MKYLLDTNILIYHLRGNINLQDYNLNNSEVYTSEICLFELYFGAERSSNPVKNFQVIDQLIQNIEVLPITNCAAKYASVKQFLFQNCTPLHNEFDILIAAIALVHNCILITENIRDFKNIPGLIVENWINR